MNILLLYLRILVHDIIKSMLSFSADESLIKDEERVPISH